CVSEPQAAPEQTEPESDQVTPLFDVSFATVAEMLTVCPCWMLCAEDGERLTEIGGEVAQPAVNIAGSRPRRIRAKVNPVLRRKDRTSMAESKFFTRTG